MKKNVNYFFITVFGLASLLIVSCSSSNSPSAPDPEITVAITNNNSISVTQVIFTSANNYVYGANPNIPMNATVNVKLTGLYLGENNGYSVNIGGGSSSEDLWSGVNIQNGGTYPVTISATTDGPATIGGRVCSTCDY